MIKLGSHVSMSGDDMYLNSVKEALSYKANTFMIYTGAPQNTIRKSIERLNIEPALKLMEENNIDPNDLVVHAPYIINLANPDPVKRAFGIEFLSEEVRRTTALKINQIVLHPGSAVGLDRKQASLWIAEGVNKVIEQTPNSNVKIALETMAGKGNEMGFNFTELKEIIDLIHDKTRVSVCFDTCHVSDSGYDLVGNYEGVLKEFDELIGLDKISVLHINDSKNPSGARKDRHENIGFGYLGFELLHKIAFDQRFQNIPKILETPYVEKRAPYYFEIEMIKKGMFNNNLKEIILNND